MATREKNWIFIFGAIITLLGVFIALFDETLAMWQHTDSIWGDFYLNAFGIVKLNGETAFNWTEDGGTYVYAGLIIIVGGLFALISGITGSKGLGFISAFAILGGLAYFFYSHVVFVNDNIFAFAFLGGMGSVEGIEIVWGTNGAVNWRIGNGAFIVAAGAIVTFAGLGKKKY
ncbi:MAG: hypothetical protein GF364_18140 [Candidatus Lokiarchaeota archaeon]|nr:hypothetical protein [Candidatus Lokiarchaeota archaeon]